MATVKKKDKGSSSGKSHKPLAKGAAKDEGLIAYFQGVKSEWGKVTWPTWPQVISNAAIVLVMVIVVSIGLWAVDNFFRFAIGAITPH